MKRNRLHYSFILLLVTPATALPPSAVNLGPDRAAVTAWYDEVFDQVHIVGRVFSTGQGVVITIDAAGTVTEQILNEPFETTDISENGKFVSGYSLSGSEAGGIRTRSRLLDEKYSFDEYSPFGVSNLGHSVGSYAGVLPVFASETGLHLLGAPSGYSGRGIARDISRDGFRAVGSLENPGGQPEAVSWLNGVASPLATPSGTLASEAFVISPWGYNSGGIALDGSFQEYGVVWLNGVHTPLTSDAGGTLLDGLVFGLTNQGLSGGFDFGTGIGFVWYPGLPFATTFENAFPGVIPANFFVTMVRQVYSDGINAHFTLVAMDANFIEHGFYVRVLDPVAPGPVFVEPDGTLVVIGTAGQDVIEVSGDPSNMTVDLNGSTYGPFSGITQIDIRSREADDEIFVDSDTLVPARLTGGPGDDELECQTSSCEIYGGPGEDKMEGGDGADRFYGGPDKDRISGGEGADLLFGGDGDDNLKGEGGNDVLIGGDGKDKVTGADESDLLLGSSLNNTDSEIEAIYQEWSFSGNPINTRITNINALGFAPVDDGIKDTLDGKKDADWYNVFSTDKVKGVKAEDVVTNY